MDHFTAGAISGAALVVSGYPFDTLKTWAQTSHIEKVTLRSLYRGVEFPLVGQSLTNASLFGWQEYFNKYTNNRYLAGSLSGMISSLIINPLELYKIRRQDNMGLRVNPFRGLSVTTPRESMSAGIYFGVYYQMRDEYFKDNKYRGFIAGGTAGLLSWWGTYPLDVIKSRVQSDMSIKDAVKMGHLWRGIGWCSLRAVVANSVCFGVYDWLIGETES